MWFEVAITIFIKELKQATNIDVISVLLLI